jgi:hypothetical protein
MGFGAARRENRGRLPVPGTTSIFLHSRIPKGIVGDCDGGIRSSPMQEHKRIGKGEKVFKEGSGNVDLCGGGLVYVRNTGTHDNPMVPRKMKSVRRKIGSQNTKPTTRSLW